MVKLKDLSAIVEQIYTDEFKKSVFVESPFLTRLPKSPPSNFLQRRVNKIKRFIYRLRRAWEAFRES